MTPYQMQIRAKLAGIADPEGFAEAIRNAQVGDLINMEPLAADRIVSKAAKGKIGPVLGALYDAGENAVIKKFQDSPYAHVAIYGGVDPQTGQHQIIHSAGAPLHDSFRIEPIDRFLKDRRMEIRQQDFTPEERERLLAYARGPMSEKPGRYSARNFRTAALPNLERIVENTLVSGGLGVVPGVGAVARPVGRGFRRALGGLADWAGEHCDPGTGTCGGMALQTRAHLRGQEEAEKALGAGLVRPGHGEWAVGPGTIEKSTALKTIGKYTPKDVESGALSALGKAIRQIMAKRRR